MLTRDPPIATARGEWWAWAAAAAAAVVLMVSVAVTAVAPVIAGGAETEHLGASTAPMGLPETAQLKATVPVKPPPGLIVMVDVPFEICDWVMYVYVPTGGS